MSVEQAAQGIIDVVNDHMVRALRVMSVERGEDPKDFTLVSFGGAGGLHVCAQAEELEMTKALVPVNAGVLSALGMLAADASRERSRTINKCVKDCDAQSIESVFSELVNHAKDELGAPDDKITIALTVDVRYQGQSNTLNFAYKDVGSRATQEQLPRTWDGLQDIEQEFHQKHEDSYGHQLDIDVELVNVRVRVVEEQASFTLPAWVATEKSKQSLVGNGMAC
jgi:N-methylhydantoinase A